MALKRKFPAVLLLAFVLALTGGFLMGCSSGGGMADSAAAASKQEAKPASSAAAESKPDVAAAETEPAAKTEPVAAQRSPAPPPKPKVDTGECVGGLPSAPVRIDVFSDFQCPACQTFYLSTMRQVLATYARDNKVCLVYHEMPLQQHQYSREAARYAIAARRIGNEQWILVADALFSFQNRWAASGKVEEEVAKALSKEDFARVKEHLKGSSIDAQIDRDLDAATRKGVRSTPTYFITHQGNEQKAVGATQFEILRQYLDTILPR